MVSFDDTEYVAVGETQTGVAKFRDWLLEEWPGTKPELESTTVNGVFTVSVNQAADGSDLIEKFRSINWFRPDAAVIMLRREDADNWTIYKINSMTVM